jgi:hypothetical protein
VLAEKERQWWRWSDHTDVVGAMIYGVAGGEAVNAFLISDFELGLEEIACPIGSRAQTK